MLKQQRQLPDLLDYIAELEKRISSLETSRRLGNASIDGGALTVRGGDINVRSNNDNLVTKIQHGTIPTIQYFPGDVAVPTSRTTMFGWLASDGSAWQASCETISPDQQSGGKLLLLPNTLYLSMQRPSMAEAYMAISPNPSYPEHFRFQGRWIKDNQFAASDAMLFGQLNVGAGFGAAGIAFTYAFDVTPIVLFSTVEVGGGTVVASGLSTLDNTGFTVAWASGTTAKFINWVAFRL